LNDNIGIGYPNQEIDAFIHWLKNGQRLTAVTGDLQVIKSNVVTDEAYKFIDKHWEEVAQKVTSMLPPELRTPYRLNEHHDMIAKLVKRLQQGVPPNEISHLSGEPASFQDILAAAWAHKIDQIAKNPTWGSPEDYGLLFRLVLKACESSFVHSLWDEERIKDGP
jgi:hypothetical protein